MTGSPVGSARLLLVYSSRHARITSYEELQRFRAPLAAVDLGEDAHAIVPLLRKRDQAAVAKEQPEIGLARGVAYPDEHDGSQFLSVPGFPSPHRPDRPWTARDPIGALPPSQGACGRSVKGVEPGSVPSSGLRQSAHAISERVGPDAAYSSFVPPTVRDAEADDPRERSRVLRFLSLASLALFVFVLIMAAIVALGF